MALIRERAAAALRRLAQRRDLKAVVLGTPGIYTALKHAARRYVAGETREDALQLARSLADRGHRTTIDFMGEDTRDLADARTATEEFMSLCHALTSLRGPVVEDASVLLDLSHIGLAVSERVAIDHADAIADALADDGRELMISMESSAATETIVKVQTALSERHPHVGITLQAALRRTDTDLAGALDRPGRIRLVKGAYGESESIALPRGPELDERYRRLLDRILDAGHRCSVGTHDPSILHGVPRIHAPADGQRHLAIDLAVARARIDIAGKARRQIDGHGAAARMHLDPLCRINGGQSHLDITFGRRGLDRPRGIRHEHSPIPRASVHGTENSVDPDLPVARMRMHRAA